MQVTSMFFKKTASMKLDDPVLQESMRKFKGKFVDARAKAVAEVDAWEAVRTHAAQLRDRTHRQPRRLPRGVRAQRHAPRAPSCTGPRPPRRRAASSCEIARANGVRKVTKSKSMVSEEVNLNERARGRRRAGGRDRPRRVHPAARQRAALAHRGARGAQVEGAGGRPLHGRAPQAAPDRHPGDDARGARGAARALPLAPTWASRARTSSIAETGTTLTVTNEGNADLVTTMPRIHCVITGIEKVIPTLEDFATLIRLLPRSATGQTIANYLTLTTGVKAPGETDGPEQMHIVLVDAGRTKFVGTDMQEMLRCIRCGACMNHCPVYQNVGGHAYGWVYPGPMGSILTPTYVGHRERGRPAQCVDLLRRMRGGVPGEDPAARPHAQAAREAVRGASCGPGASASAIAAWSFAVRRPAALRDAHEARGARRRRGWAGATS